MIAAPIDTASQRRWNAELLLRSFPAAPERNARLLRRVEELYAPVFRLDLSEADVGTFLSFLYLCTRLFRPRAVVQTGTAAGASSAAIALGLRDNGMGMLHTIDPEPPSYYGVDNPVSIARRVAARAGLDERIRFVRGYSALPLDGGRMHLPDAPTWQLPEVSRSTSVDMLVVDGDHTFLGCYLDLFHGAAGLAPDGPRVVVCHDYLGIPDVRRAVNAFRDAQPPKVERLVVSPCGIKFFQL